MHGHCRTQVHRPCVPVEKLGLCLAVEQGMVFVLPVQRDEAATQLAQLFGRCRSPVDSCRAPFAELALEHDRRPARLEYGLHGGSLRSMPDLIGPSFRPEGQAQGVDDERFAAAGLAGQEVEAGSKTDSTLRDQSKVADLQLFQHWRPVPEAPCTGRLT